MANEAKGGLSASILFDEIKSRLNGSLNYTPADNTQKWVYKRHSVPVTPEDLFVATDEFLGNASGATANELATGDKVLWIAIKHSGFLNSTNATTKEGIMVNWTGTAPVFDGTNDASTNNTIIAPNELLILKLNGVLVEDLMAGTCVLSGGVPSAIGTSTVYAHVAAVIEDISA